MAWFSRKKEEIVGTGKNKHESLYRKKKQKNRRKTRNQFPLIQSMKLRKISPSALVDFLANSKDGLLNSFEILFNENDVEKQKGYLVIALSEDDFKKAKLTRTDNRRDFGEFTNSINRDLIRSATLPRNIEEGYVVLVPSSNALETLGEYEELTSYADGFYWAVFPGDAVDSSVDEAKAYILKSRVTYQKLQELSNMAGEDATLELDNIQYNDSHDIIDADILLTTKEGNQVNVTDITEQVSEINQEQATSDNINFEDSNVPETIVNENDGSNEESRSETVPPSTATSEVSNESQNESSLAPGELDGDFDDLDTINVGQKEVGHEVGSQDSETKSVSSEIENDSNGSENLNSEVAQTDEAENNSLTEDELEDPALRALAQASSDDIGQTKVNTADAASFVGTLKTKLSRYKHIDTELGVELDLSELDAVLSKNAYSIPLVDDVSENELEKMLNVKRQDANERLRKLHEDNVKTMISLYSNSVQQGLKMVRKATDFNDDRNEFGRRKAKIDNEYQELVAQNQAKLTDFRTNEEKKFEEDKQLHINAVVAKATQDFIEQYRPGLEARINNKENELQASAETNRNVQLDELAESKEKRVASLYEDINQLTLERITRDYNSKFYSVEKELAEAFMQDIEDTANKYYQAELSRQKTVQSKLDSDKTVDNLKTKLLETEESKQVLIVKSNAVLEKSEREARENLKNLQAQFDRETEARNKKFADQLNKYEKELESKNATIAELKNKYEDLERSSRRELEDEKQDSIEKRRKLINEHDEAIRDIKAQTAKTLEAQEKTMTERIKQNELKTTRAVRNAKTMTAISLIVGIMFGGSVMLVGSHYLDKIGITSVQTSKVSKASSSHKTHSKKASSSSNSSSAEKNNSTSEVSSSETNASSASVNSNSTSMTNTASGASSSRNGQVSQVSNGQLQTNTSTQGLNDNTNSKISSRN